MLDQKKYAIDMLLEALEIKFTSIHMDIETDIEWTDEQWEKYDRRFLDALNLITQLKEENY